ncbi:biliverdin-producing heme oxygenase [Aestuariivirga sp.]|uniref:biliverdin-producing heme oxygenase n=1 Tax=Aestuariivirga sp. TaxID=2650926 RepID=UPI003592EE43
MTTDFKDRAPSSQSLRFRLRDRTQDSHQRLDASLEAQGMMRSLDGYRAILKRFIGLYRPLERQLEAIAWGASGIDAAQRQKAGWLKADLENLGLSSDEIERLPDCSSLPRMSSVPEGLGALYVIEGATLGGQVIIRHIQSELQIDAASGGRFFSAYGDRTGLLWREFVAVLDRHGHDREAAATIENTAIETFRCFESWMCGAEQGEAVSG